MYFKYKDISMYYEIQGNGKKKLLLLPGWGDTRKSFNYLIDYLSNYFTVYSIDYPGFGNSNFPNHDLTIFDYSNLIYEFIKENKLQDPILIGHSFGGRIISILTGYYHYKFSNIILMDSAGIKPKVTIKKLFKRLSYKLLKKLGRIIPKKYQTKYYNNLFKRYASRDYQELSSNMRKTFQNVVNTDLKNYLKYIDSNVLLIWGNSDMDTPISDAKIMNSMIKNSELIIIDKVGHFPYLERPELIKAILFEQLKDLIRGYNDISL